MAPRSSLTVLPLLHLCPVLVPCHAGGSWGRPLVRCGQLFGFHRGRASRFPFLVTPASSSIVPPESSLFLYRPPFFLYSSAPTCAPSPHTWCESTSPLSQVPEIPGFYERRVRSPVFPCTLRLSCKHLNPCTPQLGRFATFCNTQLRELRGPLVPTLLKRRRWRPWARAPAPP